MYLLGNVLQTSLLGAQDSVTSLIAIVCSTVINVVEDFVEAVKLGLGGAATATTAAEMIGKCTILGPSWKKLLSPNSKKEYGILLPYGLKDDSSQSTRAFLKFAAGPHPDLWEDRRVRGHGPRRRHTRLAPEHFEPVFFRESIPRGDLPNPPKPSFHNSAPSRPTTTTLNIPIARTRSPTNSCRSEYSWD